ncbi:hypothetical protein [Flavobacterium sp. HSC-61S13]|uniref:hypothetical protein n=1 Tax=Flavobacterium sp. HSC-61S13 TaxID=2910963 RepID=UPI0020A1AF6F|nr:hypothetical protein [Flavobacterium sp. HSC-61S13]MCP1994370.1 hypothetical protein [Flavobacterium sp. HSC-61S13]
MFEQYYYSNEVEKNDFIEEISIKFLDKTYESEFDSRYQVAGYVIENHLDQSKLVIKSSIVNIGGLSNSELPYFGMFSSIEYTEEALAPNSERAIQTERLKYNCNGGSKGDSTITLNRLKGAASTARYGKQIAQFAQACLDGRGCVTICKAFVSVGPNDKYIKFSSSQDQLEYLHAIDKSYEILHEQLNNLN